MLATALQSQNSGLRQVDVPFEYVNGFIVVSVQFHHFLPLRFILDTGAEHTILSKRELAELLGLPFRREVKILGSDRSSYLTAYLCTGVNLQMGDLILENQPVLVFEEDYFPFEALTGMEIHGILGANVLRRFVLGIHYQRQMLSFVPAERFEGVPRGFTPVPTDMVRNKPYVEAQVQLTEQAPAETRRLLLDTGASIGLLLQTDTLELFSLPENLLPANVGLGLGGELQGFIGRTHRLQLHVFELGSVLTQFQELSNEADTVFLNDRDGILGNELLDRFILWIDYPRGQLYLKPSRRFKEDFRFDRSGLRVVAGGFRLNTFVVQSVLPGSPAEDAGVLVGDEIRSLNRRPASVLSLGGIQNTLQKREGKHIRLKVIRAEESQIIRFNLRKLL